MVHSDQNLIASLFYGLLRKCGSHLFIIIITHFLKAKYPV